MTLPEQDFKVAVEAIRRIKRKFHIPAISLAMDAGISDGHLYKILEYGFVPPEYSEVREKLFALVDRLKVKYPEEFCPQEVETK